MGTSDTEIKLEAAFCVLSASTVNCLDISLVLNDIYKVLDLVLLYFHRMHSVAAICLSLLL